MELVLFIILGYLIGSIPFGLLLTKAAGLGDVRNIGSGGIGATNVLRTGNKALAALTLILDSGKGIFAIALLYLLPSPLSEVNNAVALTVGLAAVIGHCFPIWLRFKGGKGVAAAFGVLLISTPIAGLIAGSIWLLAAFLTRISSASALITCGLTPLVILYFYGAAAALASALIALLIFIKHKDNIKRLLNGSESKIGAKK